MCEVVSLEGVTQARARVVQEDALFFFAKAECALYLVAGQLLDVAQHNQPLSELC